MASATSELGDEGDQAVLLEDLLQFGLHVLVHVGLKCALEQDPSSRQDVMQEVRHVEHHPACEQTGTPQISPGNSKQPPAPLQLRGSRSNELRWADG